MLQRLGRRECSGPHLSRQLSPSNQPMLAPAREGPPRGGPWVTAG